MRKREIKAAFFDIDGTLVSFRTHKITQQTIRDINELRRKDILVIIATGRAYYHIDNLDDLQFDGYVTGNGSFCFTNDDSLSVANPLPMADVLSLVEYQKEHPFPSLIFTDKGSYINFEHESITKMQSIVNLSTSPIRSLESVVESGESILQIDAFLSQDEENRLIADIMPGCSATRWHQSFTDINISGCNKAMGVDVFADFYGFDPSEAIAFGDGGNDVAMVKHAGIGVAMQNGGEKVRSIADFITLSVDEDGISHALRHFGIL